MEERAVEIAVIGAGTAGLAAMRAAEAAGAKPLLVEAGPYGTTCAARRVHAVEGADRRRLRRRARAQRAPPSGSAATPRPWTARP